MRILFSLVIGFFAFFLLAEAIKRVFGKSLHSFFGITLIVMGFLIGFFGKFLSIYSPIDVLSAMFLIGAGCGITFHHLLTRRYILSEELETNFVRKHEDIFERFLEILPGALTWIALTSPFWLSLTLPFALAYLIIIADVYWLLSAIRIAVLILIGYKKVEWAKKQPWLKKLDEDFKGEWEDYYHIFLLPTYKESLQVLGPAFNAIIHSHYPKDKILLAVGFEERSNPKEFHKDTIEYLEKLDKQIGGVLMSFHPFGLPGEVIGPGTNRNWMVKNAVKELEKRKIDPKKVIVTTLDCDFVVHPEFLSGMLHKYLSTPEKDRLKRSFTGIFFYYNNYWQAPTPMRLIATGSALWQLAEMVGSDKYQNFSSMSINFQSLLNVGGWIPNKVNDDSGFYWKAYFHFNGNYKVLPHYLPISADANLDETLFKTFVNQYQQLKRWAYGVEHIPFVVKEYFKRSDIDFWDKTDKLVFVMWANLKWGTLALIVTFAGLIIPYVSTEYSQSVVAINLPIVSSWILTLAFIGLFATIYVQEKTAPKRPASWNFIQWIWSYLQYLLVPVVLVTISTFPAIDAQTRLMFGRYIEYRTTNKARMKSQ